LLPSTTPNDSQETDPGDEEPSGSGSGEASTVFMTTDISPERAWMIEKLIEGGLER